MRTRSVLLKTNKKRSNKRNLTGMDKTKATEAKEEHRPPQSCEEKRETSFCCFNQWTSGAPAAATPDETRDMRKRNKIVCINLPGYTCRILIRITHDSMMCRLELYCGVSVTVHVRGQP